MNKKQCNAIKSNKEQCTRSIAEDCDYCWQHRFSRLSDAQWYNNGKIQAIITLAGILITIVAILFSVYVWQTGPTKEIQEIGHGKLDDIQNNQKYTHDKLDNINKMIQQFVPDISDQTRHAIQNVFLAVLQEDSIPEWQWPEKLQEIAKKHLELLDKWKTTQTDDPALVSFTDQILKMIMTGEYAKADELMQKVVETDRKAIKLQQETLDNRKLSLSCSLANSAELAKVRQDYSAAIDFYKEALDMLPPNERTLMVIFQFSLGNLYHSMANYKEAEPFYKHVVEFVEKLSGAESFEAIMVSGHLAMLYKDMNQLDEAELVLKRILEKAEKTLGTEHPTVAGVSGKLADLYRAMNRIVEAEPLYERALAIDEACFGVDHPSVARDLNNLAALYLESGRLKEAEPLMERALAIIEKSFDKNHPNIATALSNLAVVYRQMNRLAEAEPLIERAMAIAEANYGKGHPKVTVKLNNLAQLYQATNRFYEAELLLERALAIDEACYGQDHPDVARDLNTLAALYRESGRLKEAEPLLERALAILIELTRQTGYQHPHLEISIENYTGLLMEMGKSKEDIEARLKEMGVLDDWWSLWEGSNYRGQVND